MESPAKTPAKFSLPAIIAIVCAIASFASGALLGFVLAAVAVVFGILGMVLAFSPSVRGGFVSAFAIFAGLLGLLAAVVKAIAWLL